MADKIKLYFAESEEEVSTEGDMTNPVQINLRSDLGEEDEVRLFLEAADGFQVLETEIAPAGQNDHLWAFAPDNDGSPGGYAEWGEDLILGTVGAGSAGRIYLWVKAKTEDNEVLQRDESVSLLVDGIVEPL